MAGYGCIALAHLGAGTFLTWWYADPPLLILFDSRILFPAPPLSLNENPSSASRLAPNPTERCMHLEDPDAEQSVAAVFLAMAPAPAAAADRHVRAIRTKIASV
jgi:hypothetical protein